MAIKITSDNEKELMAAKYIFDTGVLNATSAFLEKNNLPTKLDVTYKLEPNDNQESSDDSCTPES